MAISRRLSSAGFTADAGTETLNGREAVSRQDGETSKLVKFRGREVSLDEVVIHLVNTEQYSEFINKTRIFLAWGIPNAVIANTLKVPEALIDDIQKRLGDINILP